MWQYSVVKQAASLSAKEYVKTLDILDLPIIFSMSRASPVHEAYLKQ